MAAFAVLHYRQPQASADLLPLAHGRLAVLQVADREDVGVVPSFSQRGVAEDEAEWFLKADQLLLVLHDPLKCVSCVLGFGARLLGYALGGLGEVAVVHIFHVRHDQRTKPAIIEDRRVLLFEPQPQPAVDWRVVIDPLDEEQGERLDGRRDEPVALLQHKLQLLLEVRLDRLTQHQSLLLLVGFGSRGSRRDPGSIAELHDAGVCVDVLNRPPLVEFPSAAELV